MLIDARDSTLFVVDVQGRLVPAISGWQALLDQVVWLIRVARRMEIPVIACEQYPQGLGPTHPAVAAELPPGCIAGKLHFSAVAGACHGLDQGAGTGQVVVCGMETHVCVLQTVTGTAGLRQAGCSSSTEARRLAPRCGQGAGADAHARGRAPSIVSREMVAFEWLRKADSDLFREISRNFLR